MRRRGMGSPFGWRVQGVLKPSALYLTAADDNETVRETFPLTPRVELQSVLMKPAMVAPEGTAEIVATVHNRGVAIAEGVELRCALPSRVPLTVRGKRHAEGGTNCARRKGNCALEDTRWLFDWESGGCIALCARRRPPRKTLRRHPYRY
jgi:hypothetical protein